MSQQEDFNYFKSKLPDLLKNHKGQFVIIFNKQVHGYYVSTEEALKAAFEKLGQVDFIIQEITDELRVNYTNSHFTGYLSHGYC